MKNPGNIKLLDSSLSILNEPEANPKVTEPKEAWQRSLSRAITNPKQLLDLLQLDSSESLADLEQASNHFQTFVTESYLKRIKPGCPEDPLLRQVLPSGQETLTVPGFEADPLAEKQANPVPGLLHKYHGRVLLITNGNCAINCRFCFRRNFGYSENHFSKSSRQAIRDYLEKNRSVEEVILSGGDPLLLNNQRLSALLEMLNSISHLKRIRIHTRIPVVLPERITDALTTLLAASTLPVVMVIHCNHPQEVNEEVTGALEKLKNACHSLLNQSVLLKGVNDNAETLAKLQETLFNHGVGAYYLHLLDKVAGAAHFNLDEKQAVLIFKELQNRLPGYMVPKLVREDAHTSHKTLIHAP